MRASFILLASLKCLAHSGCPMLVCSMSLFNEKTEETIRNLQRAVSDEEQITGHTQSEDGDSQG